MRGFLYVADLFNCKHIVTGKALQEAAVNAIKKAGMSPVENIYRNFPEHEHKTEYGDSILTLIVPLEQSHLVIHTWPAYHLVSIDLYTCGDRDLAKIALNRLAAIFEPKSRKVSGIRRGI